VHSGIVRAGRSLEVFDPGGGATVAEATHTFGNGIILSSVSEPGLDKTAEAAGDGFTIFQLYVRGAAQWVDDHVRRAIDKGYNAFCLTVDTDSYSQRERDIARRHQRQRVRVADARIFQAQFNWRDVERIKKSFDIPLILKGIATAEDAKIAVEHGVDCVYVSNHAGCGLDRCLAGGRRSGRRPRPHHRRWRDQPRHRRGQGADPRRRRSRLRPPL
jgi:isopentenyl diphosphate isomerase/L-lactate dehydrogenase-like FMN-dependent dehydrogenase